MRVAKITSNLKRGCNVELGPVTVIVGEPTAGKTSIVQSLKLGLEGKLDDLPSNVASEYLTLLRGGQGELKIELQLTDDKIRFPVTWSVEGTTSRASRPRWEPGKPMGALLWKSVRAILDGQPKEQRQAILLAAAPERALDAARALIPEAFCTQWDAALAAVKADPVNKDAPEPDLLVLVYDNLSAALRRKRKIAKATPEEAPPAVDEIALAAAKSHAEAAAALEQAARRRLAAGLKIAQLEADLDFGCIETGLPAKAVLQAARDRLKAAKLLHKWMSERTGRQCLACSHTPDPLAGQLHTAAELQAQATAKLADFESQLKTAEGKKNAADVRAELDDLRAQDARDLAVLGAIGEATREEVVAEALARREVAEGELRELQGRADARNEWRRLRASATEAAGEVDALAALVKSADRAVKEVLSDSLDAFTARAQMALPPSYKLGVQLYDGSRSVCRLTLQNGEGTFPWRGLSGVQKAYAISSVASAMAHREHLPVKLLVIDDVWFNKHTLVDLCQGLVRAVKQGPLTQALVCAVEYDGPEILGVKLVRL